MHFNDYLYLIKNNEQVVNKFGEINSIFKYQLHILAPNIFSMKKITFTIAAILGFSSLALAQDLYVSPTSYMYVQDEVVFVNDDIRLEAADSNIYLRDDAQLIQNTNTKNSDLGRLSVYQEQTGNQYEYSYWASPVGLSTTDNPQLAFPNPTVLQNDESLTAWRIIKQPASAAINEIGFSMYPMDDFIYDSTTSLLSSYWIYTVTDAYSYNQWAKQGRTGFIAPGHGFTMKGTPGSTPTAGNVLEFKGRPNTGDILVSCRWNGTSVAQTDYDGLLPSQVESLVGNPYPSSMDLKLLFVDPTNLIGHNRNTFLEVAVYFWEDSGLNTHLMADYEGGYAIYTPGDLDDANDDGTYRRARFRKFHINGSGGGTGSNNGNGNVGFSTNYSGNHARRYAAIGQGFMLRNIDGNAGGDVILDNSMRVYIKQDNTNGGDGAIFNKTGDSSENGSLTEPTVAMSHNGLDYNNIVNNPTIVPEMRIHTTINDTYVTENVLAFRAKGSETSFKPGFDARTSQELGTDAYLISEDIHLSIKSIAYNIDAKVPFGLVAENDQSVYSITIDELNNVSDNVDVYLFDKLNNTYTDIRNDVFEITLDAGTYNDRFEVVFRNAAQEEEEELEITENDVVNSFNVYQNNTNNVLTIKNPAGYIVKSFTMFDVTGKLIYNKQNLGNNEEYTFPTNTLSNGMYLTKVVTDQDFEITKKVMVHN